MVNDNLATENAHYPRLMNNHFVLFAATSGAFKHRSLHQQLTIYERGWDFGGTFRNEIDIAMSRAWLC